MVETPVSVHSPGGRNRLCNGPSRAGGAAFLITTTSPPGDPHNCAVSWVMGFVKGNFHWLMPVPVKYNKGSFTNLSDGASEITVICSWEESCSLHGGQVKFSIPVVMSRLYGIPKLYKRASEVNRRVLSHSPSRRKDVQEVLSYTFRLPGRVIEFIKSRYAKTK